MSENFNPLNTIRAYDLQQQMFLRRQQLEQMQRENAAKAAAIQQWGHIVPADRLPQIANMIYTGAPYDQVARAAAQLSGNLIDDPNQMQANIRYIEQLTGKPYDYATLGPPVAGPNTAKQANDWKVNQAGQTAASTALGQKTGEQAATANAAAGLKDDTSPETTASNIRIMETMTGKPWDNPYAPVVGPNTQKARADFEAQQAGAVTQAQETGRSRVTGVDPTKPLIANPLLPPTAPSTAPTAAAPAPAPITQTPVPPGATPDPNRTGWYWRGSTLSPSVTTGGPAGTVFGVQPNDLDVAKTVSGQAQDALTKAYAEGGNAAKLKTTIAQIRALEDVARTGGLYGQVTSAMRDTLNSVGLGNITTAQQAQTAIGNLIKTEVPELKSDYGLNRVAQPEIALLSTVTGNENMPAPVLNNVLANLDAASDYLQARRDAASKTLGFDPQNPSNYPDFNQNDASLLANYQKTVDARRTTFGAVDAPSASPDNSAPAPSAPSAQPTIRSNPTTGVVERLVNGQWNPM